MPFLERANLIIPGYALLTDAQRALFEATEPGRAFADHIHAHLIELETQSLLQWVLFTVLESDE